jgi:hypothetical protein
VSSDGEVWVMCQLGSTAVPSSVAAGWVADVEEARVEPGQPCVFRIRRRKRNKYELEERFG